MKKPILNEKFADNGEHSHWELIDANTGEVLWGKIDAVLPQANVSGQSELLFAFAKYAMPDNYTQIALNNIVKTFIEERK